jgi:glycosyltransferase involved in cell wall biosynthesis
MSLIRVYHFILDHRVGGPHIYADSLRKKLSNEIESVIITSGKGLVTDIALLNIRHYWKPLYLFEVPINVLLILIFFVTGRIKAGNTVFNVHGAANIAPLIAARIISVPVIWHFHETVDNFRLIANYGKTIIKKLPHRIVVVANKSKEIYFLKNAIIMPCPIDPDYWSCRAVELINHNPDLWHNYSGDERPLRIVTIGNLNPLKGVDILLEALSNMAIPWQVKIIGAELNTFTDFAHSLYQKAESLAVGKSRSVEFMGWQDKSVVRSLLKTCDLFILPSRSEACPISLLEAMAMECICVATDVGDVRIILSIGGDDNNIVNPDAVSLRQGILNVIAITSEEKRLMNLKNRKKIESLYSINNISSIYLKVIQDLAT